MHQTLTEVTQVSCEWAA